MVITADRLITGPAGSQIRNGAVLVHDGVIAAIGPRDQIMANVSPSAVRLEYPGATLLPGLINAHAHLALDGGPDPVGTLLATEPADLADAMAGRARQLVECGITTVRDLGDRAAGAVALRAEIAAGRVVGPHILAAVAPLTPPGGHCWFFGGEVSGEREIREMVQRNAAAGADVIKVMASGGHITPGSARMWESQFSLAELRVVVAEAQRHGLPVAAHAHGTSSIADAVAAGVQTIEHCTFLTDGGATDHDIEVARAMSEQRIAACCTTGNRDWLDMIDKLGEPAARKVYQRYPWLAELGVPMIIGTDSGVQNAVFDDFVGTLSMYEWLGFPPARIIEMTTVDAARALGIAGRTGRLAPGLSADLLVVDGNPCADLSALAAVRLVVVGGRTHRVTAD